MLCMSKDNNAKFLYAISFAWQLGFFVVAPLSAFIFFGFWLDKKVGTHPFFIIAGSVVGLVITVYDIYQLLLPLINDKDKKDDKYKH